MLLLLLRLWSKASSKSGLISVIPLPSELLFVFPGASKTRPSNHDHCTRFNQDLNCPLEPQVRLSFEWALTSSVSQDGSHFWARFCSTWVQLRHARVGPIAWGGMGEPPLWRSVSVASYMAIFGVDLPFLCVIRDPAAGKRKISDVLVTTAAGSPDQKESWEIVRRDGRFVRMAFNLINLFCAHYFIVIDIFHFYETETMYFHEESPKRDPVSWHFIPRVSLWSG